MSSQTETLSRPAATTAPVRYDAIVIGAGVAGLYQLHRLREMGLKVRAFDTASGVGGTWYWNRYPGARFDSQAEVYQYWFSEELYKSWKPSERFPGTGRDRAVDEPRRRQARPEEGHPVQHRHRHRPLRREDPALGGHHQPRRSHRHAIRGGLLRHAVGAAGRPLPGAVQLQGADLPHRALAQGEPSISVASGSGWWEPVRPASR